jgi:hypothetical protein
VDEPLRWGAVVFHPSLSYSYLYGDGLLVAPDRQISTSHHSVTPAIAVNLGTHWMIRYSPSFQFYSSDEYEDNAAHSASLSGWTSWERWGFSLSYRYSASNMPLVETATQTDEQTHGLNLGASCAINAKTSLQLGLSQTVRLASEFTDRWSWANTDWLNYQLTPKMTVGTGLTLSYDMVEPGTDMTSERIQGRIAGLIGERLSYSVEGGAEFRQFLDTSAPTKLSPVVKASLGYQLFEPTSVSAYVSHDVGTSYYSDQFNETTSVGGGIRQRLLGKLSLHVGGGYNFRTYSSTQVGDLVQREDEYANLRVSLSTRFLRRGSISVFYGVSNNSSDQTGYSYDSDQGGIRISYSL